MDLAEIPQMESVRRLLLEKARSGYESLRTRATAKNDPELRWVTARAYGRLGDIDAMLGDFEKAEPSYHQAIGLLKELRAESPDSVPYVRDLVRCHLGLGILFKELYRLRDARAELLAAVELKGPLEVSGETDDRQLLAEIDYQRGVVLAKEQQRRGSPRSQGSVDAQQSEEAYQKAITSQTELVRANQSKPEQRAKLGRYLNNLGNLLAADRRWDEAAKAFVDVIDSVADTEKLPGLRWQRARASSNIGTLPWGRFSDTKESVDKASAAKGLEKVHSAQEALERLSEEFPVVPAYREELALVCGFIGQHERGKTGRAALEQALDLSRNLARTISDSPQVPRTAFRRVSLNGARIAQPAGPGRRRVVCAQVY